MSKITVDIQKAAQALSENGLVGIPTETVYGLAANGLVQSAVQKIFKAKERPSFDPLILHSTKSKIFQWAKEVPAKAKLLADEFWPGPLTLVLPKSDVVPFETTSGLDTVGLRVPNHPLTLELLDLLEFPLAAPSANPFGYISPTSAQHVVQQLGDRVDYVLDGGLCKVGIESTIVGFENGRAVIYRLGGLTQEMIEDVIGTVMVQTNLSSNPKASGMLSVHYAPKKPLFLVTDYSDVQDDSATAYMLFGERLNVSRERQFFLSEEGNFYEAASKLYALMRKLDDSKYNRIVVKKLPEESLGSAINDRLVRASVK
ncbi:MAG TPA: L-threonylcarbamoyladenylate synthase [Chitinophagales bacterium]|nr:L-threonylcarbamoyladenylate synthase [Chitinophagales bacterium]